MSEAQSWYGLDDGPSIPDLAWLNAQEKREAREQAQEEAKPLRPWASETWAEFRDTSDEEPRWLVDGLLPEGALVFVAAPPKKGKTWLALGLALSIASGRSLFGEYEIPEPRNVLYVALEGARSALRARTGCLARGLGVDPDGEELKRLHFLYRPRPLDIARKQSADWLHEEAAELQAAVVIVDVLRAAARFKENVSEEFAVIRDNLAPLLDAGMTVPLLHHFGKLSDTQKDRSPGERMAGTGAMYGALDVGFLITRSENGSRRMRIDLEARDFASPDALGVVIEGTGTGKHGGFVYTDTARFALDPAAAEERDLVGELEALFVDETWRTVSEAGGKEKGLGANENEVRAALVSAPERFVMVVGSRVGRHRSAKPWGTMRMLRNLEEAERVNQAADLPDLPLFTEPSPASRRTGKSGVTPLKGGDTTPIDLLAVAGAESAARFTSRADEDEFPF